MQAKRQGVSLNQYAGILLASASGWQPHQRVRPGVRMGVPGYMPDHAVERRADYLKTTPSQRLAEAISLSRTMTRLAVAGAAATKKVR